MAIGSPGASNAALLATSILALNDSEVAKRLMEWREALSRSIEETPEE
jgi:5-(carboxyamino)imidazole ribonucleotide mutase